MQRILGFLLFLSLAFSSVQGQQTVGLFHYDPMSFVGYSLFSPFTSTTTYLIDNCGREIHQWPGNYAPGSSTYLQPDGLLLRTGRVPSNVFGSGGIGGRIERVDWNGNVTWAFEYATADYHQHHDVELLPNGNVLVLAWESKTSAEAIVAGRDPATAQQGIWPEHIVELQPIGVDSAEIVWEWHVWDHLVQDFDSTRINYGVVADHPELFDLNYTDTGGGQRDWMHCNAIAYHPGFDQIVLNSRSFSEFWVIDHSTTTAEAASHSGGNSGRGGDILYRWGNPATYDRSTTTSRQLYDQHDTRWIPDSLPGGGSFITFNNGEDRPGGPFSSVDVIAPPVDAQGNYSITPGQPFGPAVPSWTYVAPNPSDFYSRNISGASRLPNGNTLICEGGSGTFFEVDSLGNTVWEYVNPVNFAGPLTQGDPSTGNAVFRVERYSPGYAGLQGHNLTPGSRIEQNPLPLPAICGPTAMEESEVGKWRIGPSPFETEFQVFNPTRRSVEVEVLDLAGRRVFRGMMQPGDNEISGRSWSPGLYLLRLMDESGRVWKVLRR